MKIEHPQPAFTPITITIESAKEANYLRALLSNTTGTLEKKFGLDGNFCYEIYEAMRNATVGEDTGLHAGRITLSYSEPSET